MELTDRVQKLEIGHTDHELRIKKVERENELQQKNAEAFHDYIIKTEARAEGRDKTLKVFMTVLSVIALVSPALTLLLNALIK